MSRNLPPHPNLEYLKKQAKDLLRDMRQRDPALKLADAQYMIARQYGFPSWPKLKAHVESLSRAATLAAAQSQPGEGDEAVNSGKDSPIASRPEAVPEEMNPFAGTWTANLSKSRQHPLNPFQSATLHFDVVGNTVTINDVVVDESGQEVRAKNRLQTDGKEHASEQGKGYILLARWLGPHVLEAVVKKDDRVEGRVMYEVSGDGTTLTISADGQVIVCDRL